MARELPSQPKALTTKYENFRGVDFTNDASNVWYRRSPSGVNMLPNLDGQPFKRNGWKVEFTSEDFCEAANISPAVDVTQYKVDYFELGGADYLWFYTSIGCFYYAEELTFVDKAWEIQDPDGVNYDNGAESPGIYSFDRKYRVGDLCYTNVNGSAVMHRCTTAITTPEPYNAAHWTDLSGEEDYWRIFPPTRDIPDPEDESQTITVPCDIDYSKSFFFEGQGRAAYYLFVDDIAYWFDGTKLHLLHGKVPTVLTMCDNKGVGTALEDVNLLTPWRYIAYTCAEGSTEYTIPDGFDEIGTVQLINAKGQWINSLNWERSENEGAIVMTQGAPAQTFVGQNNLRIMYKPAGATITENVATSGAGKLVMTKTTVVKLKQTYNKTTKKWTDGSATTTITYATKTAPSFTMTNAKKPVETYLEANVKNGAGAWGGRSSSITAKIDSYGNNATLSGTKNLYDIMTSITETKTTKTTYQTSSSTVRYKLTTTVGTKNFDVRIKYTQWLYTAPANVAKLSAGREAFFASSKSLVFGNGIINQVFFTASTKRQYNNRVWYSAATNPCYIPDLNYIEVGSTDKATMGLMKVGEYLGIIKQGAATDTSIYLAYPTSFEETTTYAVKQSVNGIGAISNGAFNILNDEPLFLSEEGVMGIEPAENEERKIRNRSYYINKALLAEPSLESAVSFVFNGMYWLCVNDHCYVLDGSQKSSWANTKTNLQYECYYLENIPAKCFAKKDGMLWFIDQNGNVCRFRKDEDELQYVDEYAAIDLGEDGVSRFVALSPPENGVFSYSSFKERKTREKRIAPPRDLTEEQYVDYFEYIYANGYTYNIGSTGIGVESALVYIHDHDNEIYRIAIDFTVEDAGDHLNLVIPSGEEAFLEAADAVWGDWGYWVVYVDYQEIYEAPASDVTDIERNDIITYGNDYYTVLENDQETNSVIVSEGVPIKAVWGTIADDDGAAHYYKTLQKKGNIVALMPMSDSGVRAYVIPDEKDRIFVGETDVGNHILPFNYLMRKKVKKYKRLQILVENDSYNDGFGVDEIIKSYTLGNYAKK